MGCYFNRLKLFKASLKEVDEDGVGVKGTTLVFGMELSPKEKWVNFGGKFNRLNQTAVRRSAADNESLCLKNFFEFVVEFVAVSMTFGDGESFPLIIDFC